ncbi:hypothetical protein LIER_18890 [Lithospermum erythrorhizon]|uniref:C2H2-type domain-containing protein n=1 Tax=Lithospermum erythrorhizon TaxID=34254 RepID=A0AAV3QFQ3_LITER
MKQTWDTAIKEHKFNGDNHDQVGELNGEFLSWPPRSYTCSFCKKEFRSSQALGGHMNIHRRDRARLRQYYSPLKEASNYHLIFFLSICVPAISSLSCGSTSTTRIKSWHKRVEMTKKKTMIHQDLGSLLKHKKEPSAVATATKNVEIDALDKQTGLQKKDLDLELRLGYT